MRSALVCLTGFALLVCVNTLACGDDQVPAEAPGTPSQALPNWVTDYPKNVPLSVLREVMRCRYEQKKEDQQDLKNLAATRFKEIAASLDSLQNHYDQTRAKYAPSGEAEFPWGSGGRAVLADLGARGYRNPNHDALREMWNKTLEDNLRCLVNRHLEPKEREEFIGNFKNLSRDQIKLLVDGNKQNDPAVKKVSAEIFLLFLEQGLEYRREKKREEREEHRLSLLRADIDRLARNLEKNQKSLDSIGSWQRVDQQLLRKTAKNTWALLDGMDQLADLEKKTAEELGAKVDAASQQVMKLSNTVDEDSKKIEANHKALLKLTKQNKRNAELLEANTGLVIENSKRIDSLTAAVFPTLPISSQRLLAESGALNLDEKDRKPLQIKLERLDMAEKLDGYLDGGKTVLKGLKGAGLDPEIADAGMKVFDQAKGANDVFKAVIKGDPLAAAGALVGLIFGGGPDVDELRHREIMEALGKLKEGQEKILKKLDEIEKKVDELKDIVINNQRQLMEELETIKQIVICTHMLIIEQYTNDLRNLRNTIAALDKEPTYAGKWGALKHVGDNQKFFGEGQAKLSTLMNDEGFGRRFPVSLLFWLNKANAETDPDIKKALFRVQALQAFIRQCVPAGERELLLNRLVDPCFSVNAIGSRLGAGLPKDMLPKVDVLTEVCDPLFIREFADLAAKATPYILLRDPDAHDQLLSEEKLTKADCFADFGKQSAAMVGALTKTLKLVNLAIAQQAMLSGDALLPYLAKNLDKKEALYVLALNPLIRENLALYLSKGRGVGTFAYSTFLKLANQDNYYLTGLFNSKWNPRFRKEPGEGPTTSRPPVGDIFEVSLRIQREVLDVLTSSGQSQTRQSQSNGSANSVWHIYFAAHLSFDKIDDLLPKEDPEAFTKDERDFVKNQILKDLASPKDIKTTMPSVDRFDSGTLAVTQELIELYRVRSAIVDQIAALESIAPAKPEQMQLISLMLALGSH